MAQTARILLGLLLGLLLGVVAARTGASHTAIDIVATLGGLWLDSLRMTVLPLVFALVVTGIASAAARGMGGVTGRAALLFVALLLGSALVGAALGSAQPRCRSFRTLWARL